MVEQQDDIKSNFLNSQFPVYNNQEKKQVIDNYNQKPIIKANKLKLGTLAEFNTWKWLGIAGIIFLILGAILFGVVSYTIHNDGSLIPKFFCGNTTVNVPPFPTIPPCPSAPACVNNCNLTTLNVINNTYINQTINSS